MASLLKHIHMGSECKCQSTCSQKIRFKIGEDYKAVLEDDSTVHTLNCRVEVIPRLGQRFPVSSEKGIALIKFTV